MWFLFLLQITITFPSLLITLHLSHIGLTDGLTFIVISSVFIKRLGFASPDNSAFRQVVRAHLNLYRITGNDFDVVQSQFARDIRCNRMTVGEFYDELRIG